MSIFVDAKKKLRITKVGFIYNIDRRFLLDENNNYDVVDRTGLEPATPTLQMWCSTR